MRFVLLVGIALLAGCAMQTPGCADLPGAIRYCLQPPSDAAAFSVRQKVVAQLEGRREALMLEIDNTADSTRVIAMTPFGHAIVDAQHGKDATLATRLPDDRLTPEMIIGLVQVALWPAEAVQRGLGDNLRLEDRPEERLLYQGDTLLARITHDASPAPYRWMEIDVPTLTTRLRIDTLQ